MPIATNFGAAAARAFGFTGGSRGATFIGASSGVNDASGSYTINFAALGAQVGDIAVIHSYVPLTFNNTTAAGWNRSTFTWAASDNYVGVTLWRVLSSTSVTLTSVWNTANEMGFGWCVYRGATIATQVSTADGAGGAASVTAAGFTKAANSRAILSIMASRAGNTNPTQPSGFSRRIVQAVGTTFGTLSMADLTPSENYANGTSLTWSALSTSDQKIQLVWELS